MVPPLRSHILPFAFLFLPLVPLYAKLPLDEERHLNCSTPENCAGFHITYPFFLRDDREEDYCGHPGYGLECDDEKILTLMIHDDKYQVLNITKENQSLIVARMDILNDGCPEQSNDFTLDHRFNFTDNDLEATLLLDCSPEDHPPPQLREYFICSPSDGSLTNRLTLGPDENSWKPHCSASLKIRMLRSAAQNLTDNKINSFQALQKGFEVSWGTQINATECLACMNSGGACGYNASLSTFSCYCVDGAHQGTCSGPLLSRKSRWKVKLGIALLSTLVFAVVASVLIVIRCCNLRSCSSQIDENSFDVENFTNGIIVRKYPYSELKRITNSFSIKLGEGGYGSVYKGSLKDGRPVAVKILNVSKESCGEDFFNEVASISRTAHVNVVALLGFCYERKRRALVYEFMPNGSLDKFITTKENSKRSSTLECKVLYKITLGIARGLEYLHRGCNTRIVHFDIKPHNILLDQDFVPKISDFGLAKLWQGKESMVSMLGTRGTIGYIAPEVFCRNFGGVSHKSDVYSYGMLVLDMVCGRYNSDARVSHTSDAYFPDWIYKEYLLLGKEITLSEITTEEEEEITRKMIIVSLWCIQNRSSDRPCIKEVIEMLEGSLQSLQLPILKPFQASPERLPEFNFPSSSQSLYSS